MTEQFLSITEAHKYAGQTRNRIRRFVEAITKPESHPDRGFIQPSPGEVEELHAKNHPFSWKISTVLLDREFSKEGSMQDEGNAQTSKSSDTAFELLTKTIAMLETELAAKNKQIDDFLERQRETNLIMLPDEKKKHADTDSVITVFTDQKNGEEGRTANEGRRENRPSLWERLNRPLRIRR